ncbi:MAG: aminodeoxychorismate synthase component I [Proteobacteria bacterium]|nr:aminodeoxychorismate synthase component I [Pseudomonadota bacterium]
MVCDTDEQRQIQHRARRVELLPGRYDAFALVRAWSDQEYVVLLDSAGSPSRDQRLAASCEARAEPARWSILAADPFAVFRSRGPACFAGPVGRERRLERPPLRELASLLERYRIPVAEEKQHAAVNALPFTGGAMGYLGYELLHQIERISHPERDRGPASLPDCYLLFFDTVAICNIASGELYVAANGFGASQVSARRSADERFVEVASRLRPHQGRGTRTPPPERRKRARLRQGDLISRGIEPVICRADYLRLIETTQEHIREGDVFEVCLCNRFDTEFAGSGFELYAALRQVNPAPFAAYLQLPEVQVLSSSPERFLRLDRERRVETRPIKGTRPRGHTLEQDRAHARDLFESEKDRAENIMIVDLARNDLGRVCQFGSVGVSELQAIESFEFTHQMVSTVQGLLRPSCDPIDLLRATFPGGSMTGAPKIAAMKIIEHLEPVTRGVFAGSIGYFDFDGALDLSIVIRTFIKQGDSLSFHVGGAIVADSDASEEHQETLDKASGLVAALDRYQSAQQRGR